MTRIASVVALLTVLTLSVETRAGGPPPLCMSVDKIVFEPNDRAPSSIQIWGTFIQLEGSKYGAPVRGYLYYTVAPGKEEQCRKEWTKLRKLATQNHIVAFGMCGVPNVDGHVRKLEEKPKTPIVFPLCEIGFRPGEDHVDRPALKELLVLPSPAAPVEGERLTPGKIILKARNIRDPEHVRVRYVFEIENSFGEKEQSPPITAGERQTEWSPKMEVKAGVKYTWRVRATEGTWQGPSTSSSFLGRARS